jgi:transcription elongation factor Elf1
MMSVELQSTITCPTCGHVKEETMPTDFCQWFYECEHCHAVLRPEAGDCCVFCSYGSNKCLPIQQQPDSCCSPTGGAPLLMDSAAPMAAAILCPVCGNADVSPVTLDIDSHGDSQALALRALQCTACGEGVIEDSELRRALGEVQPQEESAR